MIVTRRGLDISVDLCSDDEYPQSPSLRSQIQHKTRTKRQKPVATSTSNKRKRPIGVTLDDGTIAATTVAGEAAEAEADPNVWLVRPLTAEERIRARASWNVPENSDRASCTLNGVNILEKHMWR